jgi:predicted enzyme related to lactoylglutathione lyase
MINIWAFSFWENLYVNFKWVNENNPAVPGNTIFSFFKNESNYFEPSGSPFMINFRVKNLKTLLEKLNKEGVNIIGETAEEKYGKFGWILDPEGNKIELWEPYDDKL